MEDHKEFLLRIIDEHKQVVLGLIKSAMSSISTALACETKSC